MGLFFLKSEQPVMMVSQDEEEEWGLMCSSGGTYISQVECDLQVGPELVSEVRIHVHHLQQVLSLDLVKVAVGQSPDVRAGFAWPPIKTDGFTKDIVLPYRQHSNRKEEHWKIVTIT